MNDMDRALLSAILETLKDVSYTALIESANLQGQNRVDIELLEGNRATLTELIERFREANYRDPEQVQAQNN